MLIIPRHSVISHLLRPLVEAPFRIAPERAAELLDLTKRHDIVFTFDSASQLNVPEPGRIVFGACEAERLWAAAYAYSELLAIIEEQDGHPGSVIDFTVDPSRQTWRGLLSWAMRRGVRSEDDEWPLHLPKPTPEPQAGTPMRAATEWFLTMGGWMLLHELGHVVNDHFSRSLVTDADRHKCEYEADDWASAWLLDGWRSYAGGSDERVFAKRSIGAALALCVLTSWEVYDRQGDCPTHPDPAKRLLHFLDRFVPESGERQARITDAAWYVVMIVLQFHLVNAGRTVQRPEGYRSMREYILDAIHAL